MSPLIKYLLKTPNKRQLNSHQVGGFTMVELLVATVMSFLIITPILAFAVNILNDDVKEQAKASTELELQSAMDYIQQDISQAYYIYDGEGVKEVQDKLYYGTDTTKIPVLVFWKRELVRNAINATTQTVCLAPASDDTSTTPICDDTYVDSLVVYYLVPETDKDSKWCQPGGTSTNCPSRIERWSIKDGVKSANGTYVCGTEGNASTCDADDKKTFKRSPGMPYTKDDGTGDGVKFSKSNPGTWAKSSEAYDTNNKPNVLVNYIDVGIILRPNASPFFCSNALGLATTSEINYRIGTNDQTTRLNFTGFSGCVDSSRNIAQITIRGDALRRNDGNRKVCAKESPNCPSVTGQIGGRSGFGQ
jgi:type II secretory pathway pseudopilin PulG